MSGYQVGKYYVDCDGDRYRCVAYVSESNRGEHTGWWFTDRAGETWVPDNDYVMTPCHPACNSFDWQPPDPGEGYRLIDPAVDQSENGDEIWLDSKWTSRGPYDGEVYDSSALYRRKLPVPEPAPAPVSVNTGWRQIGGVPGGMLWFAPDDEQAGLDVGNGYRQVGDDEQILSGDDFLDGDTWKFAEASVGQTPEQFCSLSNCYASFIWRRKVQP
jgi:hypothetical protein